ncbi:kinesin-like protein KIF24 [Dunckerocampus dactyliophorus]|uniref:kinesin-like protein KIF24 n=1 Tax=Dunckerocampus dactyliophorus TaxID=161453 RepID=UPI002406712E|nr:kinesin-like protein KIF24 [Dunckerocampus dactyliophorus]
MATGLWRKAETMETKNSSMKLGLFECLKAVGLQHHYERFTSMGIRHAAHLLCLTSEDLPMLEIHTKEDKSRLFSLVHLVKTLEQEGIVLGLREDADERDGKATVVDTFIKDEQDAARTKLNVAALPNRLHKRLDDDHQQRGQNSSHRPAAQHTRPDITRRLSMYNSHSAPPPQRNASSHHPKPKADIAKRLSKQPVEKMCPDRGSTKQHGGHFTKPTPVYEAKRKLGYNYGLPLQPVASKKQTCGPRILVCVRKRPLTPAERRTEEADVVMTPSAECVIVEEGKEAVDLTQYILQHPFYFDQVFGEHHSNEEVYKKTAYPLVQHMLNGGKATCFAFGQTGAGKTHTMMGSSPDDPGLYVLAVQDIFAHLSATHSPLLVYVSFCEIYCRQLYDLLNNRKRLFVREDGHNVVHIAGLCDVRVDSVNSLMKVMAQGLAARSKRVSGVNPLSSRSHALLQIQLRSASQQITGRMWFIDLAGSERASDTKATDWQTRMEGAEINQSLLALKECIRSLDQEQRHTPFRQSKLTQVLKDSFVGNSMTCMIANISPGHVATEHTLNTLRYADRVKELRGHGGRESRTIPLSKCTSRDITRGKSLPKKTKTGTQRASGGTISPTPKKPPGCAIHCSTPKSSRSDEERTGKVKRRVGPEQASQLRGSQEKGDGCKREDKREHWRKQENQYKTEGNGGDDDDDDAVMVDQRNAEMQQHLHQYHQQLQKFVPFSVTSSSSSRQSLSSQASSAVSFSDRMYPGLKDVLSVYDSGIGSNGTPSPFKDEERDAVGKEEVPREQTRWAPVVATEPKEADVAADVGLASFNSEETGEDSLEMDPSLDGLWTDSLLLAHSVHKTDVFFNTPTVDQSLPHVPHTFQQTSEESKKLPRLLTKTQAVPSSIGRESQAQKTPRMSQEGACDDSTMSQRRHTNNYLCRPERKQEHLTHAKGENSESCPAKNPRDPTSDAKLATNLTEQQTLSLLPHKLETPAKNLLTAQEPQPVFLQSLLTTQSPSNTVTDQRLQILSGHHSQVQTGSPGKLDCKARTVNQEFPLRMCHVGRMDHARWRVIQAHWEKLREMEPLLQEEQTLLCKQPHMPFGDYVDKLEEIMERNARCLHSMRTKLHMYRMSSSLREVQHNNIIVKQLLE